MITFDAAMQALDEPAITGLVLTALDESDMVNLILQRSEIIRDQPRYNRYIRAWTQGDDAPMRDLIDRLGVDVLARRAAAFIYLEYLQMRPEFEAKPPKHTADIGCGYAFFDLFLAQDFGCDLALIDLENNETRHFGFEAEGAAYSSLKVAKKLLVDNGVPAKSIKTFNPETDDVSKLRNLDHAFSFISCGFHYPWTTYRTFFEQSIAADGRIILDLRARTLGAVMLELSDFGYIRALTMAANNSAFRVMILKAV